MARAQLLAASARCSGQTRLSFPPVEPNHPLAFGAKRASPPGSQHAAEPEIAGAQALDQHAWVHHLDPGLVIERLAPPQRIGVDVTGGEATPPNDFDQLAHAQGWTRRAVSMIRSRGIIVAGK